MKYANVIAGLLWAVACFLAVQSGLCASKGGTSFEPFLIGFVAVACGVMSLYIIDSEKGEP